jgi:hypothetical protein
MQGTSLLGGGVEREFQKVDRAPAAEGIHVVPEACGVPGFSGTLGPGEGGEMFRGVFFS